MSWWRAWFASIFVGGIGSWVVLKGYSKRNLSIYLAGVVLILAGLVLSFVALFGFLEGVK